MKSMNEYKSKERAKALEEQAKVKDSMNLQIEEFKKACSKSDNLSDHLQDLANHLKEFTGAAACYIGKVTKPIKKLGSDPEDDVKDEDAHLVAGAKPEIQFVATSAGCEFLHEQVLL